MRVFKFFNICHFSTLIIESTQWAVNNLCIMQTQRIFSAAYILRNLAHVCTWCTVVLITVYWETEKKEAVKSLVLQRVQGFKSVKCQHKKKSERKWLIHTYVLMSLGEHHCKCVEPHPLQRTWNWCLQLLPCRYWLWLNIFLC